MIVAAANRRLDDLQQISGFSLWPEADFPKTTTLKIQKFKVRQRLRESQRSVSESSSDPLLILIVAITGGNPRDIPDEALLIASLGLTSIGRLELIGRIEQEFRLDLDDAAVNQETRVVDLRRMIAEKKKISAPQHFRFWTNTPCVRSIRQGCDLLLHYPLLRCFVALESVGTEQLVGIKAPLIFIANHTSLFDQPTIMAAFSPSRRGSGSWSRSWVSRSCRCGWPDWKRFCPAVRFGRNGGE